MARVSRNTTKKTDVEEIQVDEVKEPETKITAESDKLLFVVKLDSKRFEGRTLNQAIDLITGSVGVVSKITVERQ